MSKATKRRARASSTKSQSAPKRLEEAVCAVCGKFYPTHLMTVHTVERVEYGAPTIEKVTLCPRDAEKVMAGERPHLRHIHHHGSKAPHLNVPSPP